MSNFRSHILDTMLPPLPLLILYGSQTGNAQVRCSSGPLLAWCSLC